MLKMREVVESLIVVSQQKDVLESLTHSDNPILEAHKKTEKDICSYVRPIYCYSLLRRISVCSLWFVLVGTNPIL